MNIKKTFSNIDQERFDECLVREQEDEIMEAATSEKGALTWKQLENASASMAVRSETVIVTRIASSLVIPTALLNRELYEIENRHGMQINIVNQVADKYSVVKVTPDSIDLALENVSRYLYDLCGSQC